MSTSILYHAFGLKGIEYRSTRYVGNFVIFSAEMNSRNFTCPKCKDDQIIYKGNKHRWLRMPPVGRKLCILDLLLHRVQCCSCHHVWWPRLPFMLDNHSFVRSFALYVQDMLKYMTIQDVASILNVGWDMIKNIHKLKLKRMYRIIPITNVTTLGIDEFSIRKRHSYMTIFVDLASGRIIHAVEGTTKEKITPFLRKLRKRAKRLKAVAMDMSRSFFWAVREALPKVAVVFDRFHIMALMNKALDEIRRTWQSQLDKLGQKTLKGSRFLLLRNYESLPDTHKTRLNALLKVNQPLALAHAMKEQLRLLWQLPDKEAALSFLQAWHEDAVSTGIPQLAKVANTLLLYRQGILSYFDYPITNAQVEGLVNKIKTLKRQAYGYRDMEYFKLRLYHLHHSRYSFAG